MRRKAEYYSGQPLQHINNINNNKQVIHGWRDSFYGKDSGAIQLIEKIIHTQMEKQSGCKLYLLSH